MKSLKPRLALSAALLLASLAVHIASATAQTTAPAREPNSVSDNAKAAQIASSQPGNATPAGIPYRIKLGGVMGQRIETLIRGNLLKLDMEKIFLSPFRKRQLERGYTGIGQTLDGAVHFAAYTGDEEVINWKNHWIDELISTQQPDGYIGWLRTGLPRGVPMFDAHEMGCTLNALVNDYRVHGRPRSLEAAKRLGDAFIASWEEASVENRKAMASSLWTNEYPLIALSEASGNPRYRDWVRETFFPDDRLSQFWSTQLGGDPTKPLRLEGRHAYRWLDLNLTMLDLNRTHPNQALASAWPQFIAWIKDGGALPSGAIAQGEALRHSQTTRSLMPLDPEFHEFQANRTKVDHSCSKRYEMQFFKYAMRERPDAYYGDVMERTYLNGIFAAQSPTGRMIAYDLSVEGTRLAFPMDYYCCPGNQRRVLSYLPWYVYYQRGDQLYVNLYSESDAHFTTPGGAALHLVQSTDYPASGSIRVTVEADQPVQQEILFRIPAWCTTPSVALNGTKLEGFKSGSFLPVRREWKTGDVVELHFPMEWRWMRGFREQEGRAVLARGPLVYSLDPVASGITGYVDMQVNEGDPWFADNQTPSKGPGYYVHMKHSIPGYEEHMEAFKILEDITLDPATISGPTPNPDGRLGSQATVKGWIGAPQGKPDRTFVFNEFSNPLGRKIYMKLSDDAGCVDDELFGTEIHEKTVHPARWAAFTTGLDAAKLVSIPDEGLDQAWLVAPMRGSHEFEVSKGALAGRPAWLSVSTVGTGKRSMEFRVLDKKLSDGACPKVFVSVLYLDKGDCTAVLGYDAMGVEGGRPPGDRSAGNFKIGNTGVIKRHDFEITDARFDSKRAAAFRLTTDKDADFTVLGVFLRQDTAR